MADKVTSIARSDGPGTMKDLMNGLSKGNQKIVNAVTVQFQRDLIEALPELNAGIGSSGKEGSFSTTLQIKPAKKGRFKAELKPKVRAPKEPTEFDMHIDDSGQLSLGLPPGWGDDDGDDGEESE